MAKSTTMSQMKAQQEQNANRDRMKTLLQYYELMGSGNHSVDTQNKGDVQLVQQILQVTGYYKGEIDGEYSPIVDQARWAWIKDIQKDPDFAFELIKHNAREVFRG